MIMSNENEVKEEVQTEEEGKELTDEELSSVAAGWPGAMNLTPIQLIIK